MKSILHNRVGGGSERETLVQSTIIPSISLNSKVSRHISCRTIGSTVRVLSAPLLTKTSLRGPHPVLLVLQLPVLERLLGHSVHPPVLLNVVPHFQVAGVGNEVRVGRRCRFLQLLQLMSRESERDQEGHGVSYALLVNKLVKLETVTTRRFAVSLTLAHLEVRDL